MSTKINRDSSPEPWFTTSECIIDIAGIGIADATTCNAKRNESLRHVHCGQSRTPLQESMKRAGKEDFIPPPFPGCLEAAQKFQASLFDPDHVFSNINEIRKKRSE